MDGILIVNKDKDLTSRDVVNELNVFFETPKIGHAGTLDPLATGVLVTATNEATKVLDILLNEEKEYIAEITLGIKTDTLDITGNILEQHPVTISEKHLLETLHKFTKTYDQQVPLYSAVRVNGKRLYEYARNNIPVDLPSKQVTIKSLELLSFQDNKITFKTLVSKGTYIRSLIRDIMDDLNVIGTMSNLKRTRQGIFTIDDAYTLEQIKTNNYKLIPILDTLNHLEKQEVSESNLANILNGAIIDKTFNSKYLVLTYKGKLLAIYQEYNKDKTKAKPYKMFKN